MKEKTKKFKETKECNKTIIKNSKERGITLIALIVTIIVLLILASVTIATLTGENGIITNAIEARERTEIASVKEQAQLDIASWVTDRLANGEDATVNSASQVKEILETINASNTSPYYKELQDDKIITPNGYEILYSELYILGTDTTNAGEELSVKPEEWTSDQVSAIDDGEDGAIPLPDGFYYVGGTKSEGIVISDDPADAGKGTSHEVAQTLQGNQFVWVPVEIDEDFKTYKGYASPGDLESYFNCEEPDPYGYINEKQEYDQMKDKVLQYNGFYVGRYETGIIESYGETIGTEVMIKQGVNVYNNISWGNSKTDETGGAVEVAKGMYANDSVTSTLIYGVQWDAIMQWIDSNYKKEDGTLTSFVADSTGKGNYSGSFLETGSNADYAVKNIYDLAGNALEWTMEGSTTGCGFGARILRGGSYSFNKPASSRTEYELGFGVNEAGFRVALYIK